MKVTPGVPRNPASAAIRERNIQIITAAAHFLAHLYLLVFPSLALALQSAFALPLQEVLALSFWMYLLYGLGALPAGILTDLARPRLMLICCLFGMGGFALAASQATSPQVLRWTLAGLGLAASIYHPAGMALISRGVRQRGRALGVNGAFGSLGVVLAPIVTGVLAVTVGWRNTFLLLALPGLAAGVVALCLPVTGTAEQTVPLPAGKEIGRRTLSFALLCVAMMLAGIAYRGQTLVLPAYFAERTELLRDTIAGLNWWPAAQTRTVAATMLTSLAYLAGVFGQIAAGRLADRHDLRRSYFLFHALSLPLLWLLGRLADLPLLLCAIGYAFFALGMQPIENSLVAVLTPPQLRSTAYGLKFILTFGVGSLAVPLVGRWQQDGGLGAVFGWLAACIGLLLVFALLLWWQTRHQILIASGGPAGAGTTGPGRGSVHEKRSGE